MINKNVLFVLLIYLHILYNIKKNKVKKLL